MKAKVRITHRRGGIHYQILKGQVYCSRLKSWLPRSGWVPFINRKRAERRFPEGTRVMDIGPLGYDSCDSVR